MNVALKNSIQSHFSFLFENGEYRFVDSNDDYGGCIVIVQSKQLRLRFVSDRSDFFLEISRCVHPNDWIDLYAILDMLRGKGVVKGEYKHSNKVGDVKKTLKLYLPTIEKYF